MKRLLGLLVCLICFAAHGQSSQTFMDGVRNADRITVITGIPATAARAIGSDFGNFYAPEKCWLRRIDGQMWCFTVAAYGKRALSGKNRDYVLLAGGILNEKRKRDSDCHGCNGYVAAYEIDSPTGHIISKGLDLKAGLAGIGANAWDINRFGAGYAFITKRGVNIYTKNVEGMSYCSHGECTSPFYIIANVYGSMNVVLEGETYSGHGSGKVKCAGPEEHRIYSVTNVITNGYPVINVAESSNKDCQKTARPSNNVKLVFNAGRLKYPSYPAYGN